MIFFSTLSWAEIQVQDDEGNIITLKKSATKIISLAPHITEILFSAGAGSKIIGAVPYSDYPEAAKKIPRVSGYPSLDIERIISLKPDLVVVWASSSANNKEQVKKMRNLGLTVFISEPRKPIDIYSTIKRFGKLAGTSKIALISADKFIKKYNILKEKYSKKEKVNVFYQFWNKPLMTVNGQHLISNIINLCGGINVFSKLHSLTPLISIESVIASKAEVIVAGGSEDIELKWRSEWKPWLKFITEKKDPVYFIDPDLISRMGPRVLDGAEQVCQILEKVRLSR